MNRIRRAGFAAAERRFFPTDWVTKNLFGRRSFEDAEWAICQSARREMSGVIRQGCHANRRNVALTRGEQNLIRPKRESSAYSVLAETFKNFRPPGSKKAGNLLIGWS